MQSEKLAEWKKKIQNNNNINQQPTTVNNVSKNHFHLLNSLITLVLYVSSEQRAVLGPMLILLALMLRFISNVYTVSIPFFLLFSLFFHSTLALRLFPFLFASILEMALHRNRNFHEYVYSAVCIHNDYLIRSHFICFSIKMLFPLNRYQSKWISRKER